MTEITLEAYTDEINQMVEEASYLEALTHLRHILDRYPRYLKAYYILGEMLLEADLPQLAMDMFLRVLNAAPEHLLARIGLALTHDKLNNTQAAIWNLQRALELDPGNKDLGTEIRRLYERGGNVAPDYMALTRPGLARLYLRGNLYGRAEEELQQLLKENPQRIDLQLALAEAYWRDDRIVQAADACQQALDTIPYCLKANLLLGNLWLNSGQESGKRYLERAQEVDPDNHLAAELFGDASPLKEQKTAIERLVYEPNTLSVDQESAWFRHLEAASVSIGISEALPEMSESEMKLVDIAAGLESQIQIPDWLRDLGPLTEEGMGEMPAWLKEEATDVEAIGTEVEAAETLVEAPAEEEIPEWLQELQPPEAAPIAEAEGAETPVATEEIPEWLQELQPPEAAPIAEAESAETPVAAEEMPEWLQELQPPEAAPVAEAEGAETPVAAEEIPEWLQELQASESAETGEEGVVPSEAEEMFGWTSFPGAPPTAEAEDAEALAEPKGAETPVAAEEIPEWLQELQPPEAAPVAEAAEAKAPVEAPAEAVPVAPPTEGEELLSGDDALAWLAGLAEGKEDELRAQADVEQEARVAEIMGRRPAAPVAEALAEPKGAETPVAAEEIPEWLQELQPPEAAPVAEATVETPAEAVPVTPPTEGEELMSGDDALAWLAGLAEGKEDELRAQADVEQEARVAEIMGRQPAAPVAEAVEAEAEAAPVAPPTEEGEELLSGDDALAWLAGLAEGKEDELRAQADVEQEARVAEIMGRRPAAPVAEAPVEAAPVAPPTEEGEELLSGDDALAWLAGLAEGKEDELRAQADVEQEARVAEIMGRRPAAPVAEAPVEAEEIPEWLRELRPPTVAEEAPVAAAPEEEKPFFGWSGFNVEPAEAEQAPEAIELEPLTSFGFTRFKEEEEIAAPEAPVEAEGVEVPAEAEGVVAAPAATERAEVEDAEAPVEAEGVEVPAEAEGVVAAPAATERAEVEDAEGPSRGPRRGRRAGNPGGSRQRRTGGQLRRRSSLRGNT